MTLNVFRRWWLFFKIHLLHYKIHLKYILKNTFVLNLIILRNKFYWNFEKHAFPFSTVHPSYHALHGQRLFPVAFATHVFAWLLQIALLHLTCLRGKCGLQKPRRGSNISRGKVSFAKATHGSNILRVKASSIYFWIKRLKL